MVGLHDFGLNLSIIVRRLRMDAVLVRFVLTGILGIGLAVRSVVTWRYSSGRKLTRRRRLVRVLAPEIAA